MAKIIEIAVGQIVTRIKPNIGNGDRSYMGDKLIYLGIKNQHAHFLAHDFSNRERIISLAIDWWGFGWEIWEDPQKLVDKYKASLPKDKPIKPTVKQQSFIQSNDCDNLIRTFMGTSDVELVIPFVYSLGERLPISKETATLENVDEEVMLELETGNCNYTNVSVEVLYYANSWTLLIPVVEKIYSFEKELDTNLMDKLNDAVSSLDKYQIYLVVCEAITEYYGIEKNK